MKLTMTNHAAMRWLERGGPVETMNAEIDAAIKYGAQRGDDQLWLTPCGLVLAATADGVVKTTLTQALAVANMQASGMDVRTLPANPTLPERKKKRGREEHAAELVANFKARQQKTLTEIAVESVLECPEQGLKPAKRYAKAMAAEIGYTLSDEEFRSLANSVEGAYLMRFKLQYRETAV